MKVLNYKQRIIDVVIEKGKEYAVGYSVTLNMLINDPILQDIQIQKLIKWLNFYCYGNNFRRNKKRLYVVGASEIGTVNQGLHMHLIIMHNYDTDRKTKDIEDFI